MNINIYQIDTSRDRKRICFFGLDEINNSENSPVDIIARAEDASKIQRIVDRFELGKVDIILRSLNTLKTELIESGITTDAVDDLIVKVGHAPQKKLKVVEKSVDDAR